MTDIQHEALAQILKNQMKLADMIANPLRRQPEELQDDANRIAIESQRLVNRLEALREPTVPRCRCGAHEWYPETLHIQDSRGGMHYSDRECSPPRTT